MNINLFFVVIFSGLSVIFLLFKPLDVKQQEFKDIPLFELMSFTLYELDNKGLTTLMNGTKAIKYTNRYKVDNINYTDNSKKYIANIKADIGLYKDETIDLKGNVVYSREDGLIFETQKALYNKKTSIAYVNEKYVLYRQHDRVEGSSLVYNNILNKTYSKNVVAKYQMKER